MAGTLSSWPEPTPVSNQRRRWSRVVVAPLVAMAGVAALLVAVHASMAGDPIGDSALNAYNAGWYPNVVKQKYLTCAETCKTLANALPEYETSAVPPTKRAFLCRVPGSPSGWQYGTQFDTRAACYTVGLDLKGRYSERYACLCVGR